MWEDEQPKGRDELVISGASMLADIIMYFPPLRLMAASELALLQSEGQVLSLRKGETLFRPGEEAFGLPMLVSGAVRVVRRPPGNGRGLLLYHIHPGDICIQSACSLLGRCPYGTAGIAETEISGLALPPAAFSRLLANSDAFRALIFDRLAERYSESLQLVEDLAFSRLEQRLAKRLLAKSGPLYATHQELAEDLGSAREVVSRLLKAFQQRGWIGMGRGEINISNEEKLHELANRA